MKFITTTAASRRLTLATMLLGTLALASCGGGGSSTTPAVASFLDIVAKPGFLWSTAQQAKPSIDLTRSSGAALGNLTVLVSSYACGGSTNPVSSGLFTSFALTPDEQAKTAATLDLSTLPLQIPAAATYVLVEAVDNNRKIALYSKLVKPAALAGLTISVPDVPALASCPG
jgi:hypothetical protein